MRSIGLVMLLVGVAAAPSRAAGDDPIPIPSHGGVLVGQTLVNLEPDLLALRGVDLATGATTWRTSLRDRAAGAAHLQDLGGGRIYVHLGQDLAIVDAATGAIRARRQGPWNSADDRAWLRRDGGVCLLQRQCRMEMVSCETLASIGAPLDGHEVRRYRRIEGRVSTQHDTGCWGWRPFVLGRAGALAIFVTDRRAEDGPAPPNAVSPRAITVGLDAASGAVRWRSDEVTCASCSARTSGVSPDGRTCWLGEAGGTVRVFDCATGRLRFRAGAPRSPQSELTSHEAITAWTRGGLAVSAPPRIVLHDPQTGRAIWTRRVPRNVLAVPIGGRIGEEPYGPDHARTLRIVDVETGRERATASVPMGARVTQTADGGLAIDGSTRGFAPDGRQRDLPAPPPPTFTVERAPARTIVRAPRRATPLLDVPIDGESLGEIRRGTRDCAVIRLVPREAVGEIRVLCGDTL